MKLSRNVRLRLYRKKHYRQVRLNLKKIIYTYYIEMNKTKKTKTYNHYNSIADRKLGNKLEKEFETWLVNKNWFGAKFDLGKTDWCVIDYKTKTTEKKKILVELKGRRVRKHQYPTTIIGHNKYVKARKMMLKGYKVFFFFRFTDRLSFYECPLELPNSIEVKVGGTNKRGKPEYKDHLYIPIEMLKDVLDFPSYDNYNSKMEYSKSLREEVEEIEYELNNPTNINL